MTHINVLYLGMGDDIMAPLLLVPDLDNLYVIDEFDPAFSSDKTYEGQKQDIIQILRQGYKKVEQWYGETVDYLSGESEIISQEDDGTVWRLKFNYDGKERNLTFYHHRNFLIEWPQEIRDINHIMTIGSFSGMRFYEVSASEQLTFKRMMKERSSEKRGTFYLYGLYFSHYYSSYIINVKSRHEETAKIGRLHVDTNKPNWVEHMYPVDLDYLSYSDSINMI